MSKNNTRRFRAPAVQNSGYGDFGASHTRPSLENFTSVSMSPIQDIEQNIRTLRSRSRVLGQSAPMAAAAVGVLTTAVVGKGLHLHVHIDHDYLGMSKEEAKEWAANVEAEFDMWSESSLACDFVGKNDFYKLQHLAFHAWLQGGDSFSLFRRADAAWHSPYRLRIQLIDADRVSNPNGISQHALAGCIPLDNGNHIINGVEVDGDGRIVAYHIANSWPDYTISDVTWHRVEKWGRATGMPNILHLTKDERVGQLRGVPLVSSVIETIVQHSRYLNAEMVAAVLQAHFNGFVTSDANSAILAQPKGGAALGVDGDDSDDGEGEDASVREDLPLDPGAVYQLRPGEKITFSESTRPGTQFEPFLRTLAAQTGAAIEIPGDVLLKEYNSSYSASRAAIQDFWEVVKKYRDWFQGDFCAPIYAEWLMEAVGSGRIKAPGFFADARTRRAWLDHSWVGSAMPQLDPTKEVAAIKSMLEMGILTHKDATTLLTGGDWDKNISELEEEVAKLADIRRVLPLAGAAPVESTPNENKKDDE